MKDRLLIIGASGHGKVAADIALKMNRWHSIAFLDDDASIKEAMGLKVIGKLEDAFAYMKDSDLFVGIGNNIIREKIQKSLEAVGVITSILVHPHTVIGEQVKLGAGTVIMAGVVINCCTQVGKGCIINTGATVDHDNVIEDYVHIAPGVNIAGAVRVGSGAWLGIGSKVINNINIVKGCIVGAGAVVIRDITEPGSYIGVPARKIG